MASYWLMGSLLPIFLLLNISLSIARPSIKLTNVEISQICSQTQNPPLCLQVLKSNPKSAQADLRGLAQISIDIAQANAKQTSNLIKTLSNQASDPKLKGRYETCAENYQDAIDNLNEAGQVLSKKDLSPSDISTFRIKASAALDGPDTCEDSFEGPPAEPPQLQQANKKLEDLCSIVLAIGSRLQS